MKKLMNMFYCVFFMAAMIFLIYCLAEYREDLATMICATVVMLIATILFIDVLVSVYKAEKEDYLERAQARQDNANKELKKELDEILKYEKAIYVISKRELNEMRQDQVKDQVSDTSKFKVL